MSASLVAAKPWPELGPGPGQGPGQLLTMLLLARARLRCLLEPNGAEEANICLAPQEVALQKWSLALLFSRDEQEEKYSQGATCPEAPTGSTLRGNRVGFFSSHLGLHKTQRWLGPYTIPLVAVLTATPAPPMQTLGHWASSWWSWAFTVRSAVQCSAVSAAE